MSHSTIEIAGPRDWRAQLFATPDVAMSVAADGEIRLASRARPTPAVRTTLHWLSDWADKTPDEAFITECTGQNQPRATLTYGEAWAASGRIAAGLLASRLAPGERLLVIAPNGIAHMKIALAALRAGIIYVPIATQYAAPGADPAKLRAAVEVVAPSALYYDGPGAAPGIAGGAMLVLGRSSLAALEEQGSALAAPDISGIDPTLPAKLLLTSGSTGTPKAVPYSHELMTHNTQATIDVWPFVTRRKPVLVDWLPWNHAFGGSNNVHLVLSQGGTMHIDPSAGRPEGLGQSIEALRSFRPTFHGAVPAGWAALLPAIEDDPAFRQAFFSRLDVMFSAGAAMSADLFERLSSASALVRELPVPIVTGWGSTETGPGATMVHSISSAPGGIGTPMPGVEIRLTPYGDKQELSVRGPSVMKGYWGRPDLTEQVLGDDGFFRTGDAGRLIDPYRPELGLMFDGRLLDDFKLANGSWVNASGLRQQLIQKGNGALRDVVILGADKAYVAALCWVNAGKEGDLPALFAAHNRDNPGQTCRIERFSLLDAAPDAAAGEVTPKGEINRKVLTSRRPELVTALFEEG